jgi:hypothetical protein
VASTSEHYNEPSCSMKGGNILTRWETVSFWRKTLSQIKLVSSEWRCTDQWNITKLYRSHVISTTNTGNRTEVRRLRSLKCSKNTSVIWSIATATVCYRSASVQICPWVRIAAVVPEGSYITLHPHPHPPYGSRYLTGYWGVRSIP